MDEKLDKRDKCVGQSITIHDNRGICSHAGYCTDNLKSVFRPDEEPWIDPDGATAQEIIDTIKQRKTSNRALPQNYTAAED